METVSARTRVGRTRRSLSALGQFGAVAAVSSCIVLWRGTAMCSPSFLLPFACFSAVIAGPVMTDLWRQNPLLSLSEIAGRAVSRACSAMLLTLAISLTLSNLFLWRGELRLPSWDLFFDIAVLSSTAALAAASVIVLLSTRISAVAAKWAFRVFIVAALLAYQNLPPAWPIPWNALIADWGPTAVAMAVASCFLLLALGARAWLSRIGKAKRKLVLH